MIHRRYTAIVNYKKMVKILHRELKRKFEKVKNMKLEVMQQKTKNTNLNFQLVNKPHRNNPHEVA